MVRVILATIVGAVVLYIWGMVSWMVLPWHDATIDKLPNEAAMMTALEPVTPGIYVFPSMPPDMKDAAAMEAFNKAHEAGPVGFLALSPGRPAMSPQTMVQGGVIAMLTALVISIVLSAAAPALPYYIQRLIFVIFLGQLPGIMVDVNNWNWMGYSSKFTAVAVLDHMAAAGLAGLFIAAIVRPKSSRKGEE